MISANITNLPYPNTANARFAPLKIRDRRKHSSSGSHAVNALERKYQETLGKLKQLDEAEYDWDGRTGFDLASKYEHELRSNLRACLVSLENSIRLLDPTWDRKILMVAKVRNQSRPLFERNKFQSALIAVLRQNLEPLSIQEMVLLIAPGLGLPNPTADQRRRMREMAYNSLRRAYDKGFVDCTGEKPARWFARNNQSEGALC